MAFETDSTMDPDFVTDGEVHRDPECGWIVEQGRYCWPGGYYTDAEGLNTGGVAAR